jgi:AAA domain
METAKPKHTLNVVNAFEIYSKELPPTKWYVGDILHEGACLLSGDPKVGKSYLALQITIAVAGTSETVCGSLKVHVHGRVLYLALDDRSEKRIHNRLRQLTDDEAALKNIDIVRTGPIPSLADGLVDLLDQHLASKRYELVVLDTLGAVCGIKNNRSVYQDEYQEAIKLAALANTHGICLLIVHHTNKRSEGGMVAKTSGSHGRTGGVDSLLLLSSSAKGFGEIEAKPRDGEESCLYLERGENGGWRAREAQVGAFTPAPAALTPERQEVKDALAHGPKSSAELAAELVLKPDTTRKRLERMEADGLVQRLEDGRYALPESPDDGSVRPVRVSEGSPSEGLAA